jgi:ClpP class serine protease
VGDAEGMVGSIGVLSLHVDWSRSNEQQGLGSPL